MSGLHTLGRRVVLGVTWSKAASVDDVLASRDSLRKGDQGDAVSHVQRFLGIPEDGKYGSDTETAVALFQDARVTEPHERGVVNAATYLAIMAYGSGPRVAPPPVASGPSPAMSSPPVEIPRVESSAPIWKKVLFVALLGGVVAGIGGLLLQRRVVS